MKDLHCYDGPEDLGESRIEHFTYEDLAVKCAKEPHTVSLGDRVTVYSFDDAEVFQTTHDDSRISYAIIRK